MLMVQCLVLLVVGSARCWRDLPLEERSPEDYDCTMDGQCDLDNNEIQIKRKSNAGFSAILTQLDNKYGSLPHFHTTKPMPCSCFENFRWKYLGQGFYPRYLPTAVCNMAGCRGTHQCHKRRYNVRVLKQRDHTSSELSVPEATNSPLVPDALRDDWLFQTFNVTVGCDCAP